jgi:hypothetical protein
MLPQGVRGPPTGYDVQVEAERRSPIMSKQYSVAEARERLAHVIEPRSFWTSYQEFRREFGDLEVETQDAFADVRDPSPGRDFSW